MFHIDFGVVFEFAGFLSAMIATIVLNFKNQLNMKKTIILSTMLGVAHLNEEPARSYIQIVMSIHRNGLLEAA